MTAALIGAAIDAEEVQVWKDVDGLLTSDPRLGNGTRYRVNHVSYQEMADLSAAGGTILHPRTMAPLESLGIPVTIRNTFRPEGEGTTVSGLSTGANGIVKSIACEPDVTLLELRTPDQKALSRYREQLERLCGRRTSCANLLGFTREVIYVSLESRSRVEDLPFESYPCAEVHVRSGQAILTLVGEELRDSDAGDRLARAVAGSEAFIVPSHHSPRCVSVGVPMAELEFHLELLGRLFFSAPDARFFAEVNAAKSGCISEEAAAEVCVPAKTGHAPRRLVARGSLA